MRFSSRTLLTLVALGTPFAPLAAQTLTPWDVFVFQNFAMTNTESNNRLAVGGNATFTSWGVGHFLPTDYSDYSLVVGGNLVSNMGSVGAGRTYVGGAYSGTLTGFPAAYPPEIGGPSPIDFMAESARLMSISNGYAAMATTGTTQYTGNRLQFIGNSAMNIFSVSIAELQAATGGYAFVSAPGVTNIVNVTGWSPLSAFQNAGYYFECTDTSNDPGSCQEGTNFDTPDAAALTLWNFNEQPTLVVGGPVHGSILAPNADATIDYGDIVGTVVIKSGVDNGEFYGDLDFDGPLPPTATPEPATLGLLATGLLGLAGFARRRKR